MFYRITSRMLAVLWVVWLLGAGPAADVTVGRPNEKLPGSPRHEITEQIAASPERTP